MELSVKLRSLPESNCRNSLCFFKAKPSKTFSLKEKEVTEYGCMMHVGLPGHVWQHCAGRYNRANTLALSESRL